MIEGGDSNEVVTVDGSFTGFRKYVSGVKFSLTPVTESAKYPVHVYPNGRNTDPVVVTSAAWQGSTPFENLSVDVSPSGGHKGDLWRFQWAGAESGEGQRPRTDERGNLTTVGAPSVFLLKAVKAGVVANGTWWPGGVLAGDPTEGNWIDVRAYRYVKLSVQSHSGLYIPDPLQPAGTAKAFLELGESHYLGSSADPDPATILKVDQVETGADNDLTKTTLFYRAAYVGEGQGDFLTDQETRYGLRYSFVRARLLFTGLQADSEYEAVSVVLRGYP